jgi:hypothetical protein
MAEIPFISMSAATEKHGVSFPPPHTTTITMVPSGPEWITRQNKAETMSLSWGWSDGTATVSREQVDVLLKRLALVNKGIIGLIFVAALSLFVWILDGSPKTISFLSITLIVSLLLYICAYTYGRILTSQLTDMFSRGVLGKHTNHMMSDKGKEERIQVTLHNFVQWTPRQTPEEILSVEGWTEEDLTVLGPLLQRKKVEKYLRNGAMLAFLVYIYLPIIFPRVHEWEYGDHSETVMWVMFAIQILMNTAFIVLICRVQKLNGRVDQMFVHRFMQPVSGRHLV